MPAKLTYASSGVSITEGNRFVSNIRSLVKSTRRKGVLGSIGSFSGFFAVPGGYRNPVMVGATDGVGTKLLVAKAQKKHNSIGIDLVAMCVNDIVACGAEPLFFLDYLATGALDCKQATEVMKGVATGCRQAGCAILGGETAEMPGLYAKNDYDLAGFSVGMVEKRRVLTGAGVRTGDVILGLHSSGLHSNGFSLARKVFTKRDLAGKWGKVLLAPTRIYVKPVLELCRKNLVHAVAHVTGGGFYENINRSLPKNKDAVIRKGSWPVPAIFAEIQKRGRVDEPEMYRTFNMGIGMTLAVRPKDVRRARKALAGHRVKSSVIGKVTRGSNRVVLCES